MVQPDSPQKTLQCLSFACWIAKATNTHPEFVILIDFSPRTPNIYSLHKMCNLPGGVLSVCLYISIHYFTNRFRKSVLRFCSINCTADLILIHNALI